MFNARLYLYYGGHSKPPKLVEMLSKVYRIAAINPCANS